MFITPITKISGLNEIDKIGKVQETSNIEQNIPFKNVLENALNEYKSAEDTVNSDIYDLSVGNTDDLHNLMINMKNAELAFEVFVQLRNKAVESYKELLNTGL